MMDYTEEQIQENRRKGVKYLRTTRRKQGHHVLYSKRKRCYCALGHLGLAVGIDAAEEGLNSDYADIEDAYAFADYTGDKGPRKPVAINEVWNWNDDGYHSLREIGNRLAAAWGIE